MATVPPGESSRRAGIGWRSTTARLYPALVKLEQEGAVAAEWGVSENNRAGEVLPPGFAALRHVKALLRNRHAGLLFHPPSRPHSLREGQTGTTELQRVTAFIVADKHRCLYTSRIQRGSPLSTANSALYVSYTLTVPVMTTYRIQGQVPHGIRV